MASRRNHDRDPREDRERRRARETEREPTREPQRPPGNRQREKLNEFFVNGEGIHREVLQREICKYLGPEAYSKPSTYNGINGYVVTAVRPFTPEMLDDLMELSNAYVTENRSLRQRGHQDISYGESQTSQQQEAILSRGGQANPYGQERYPAQSQYSSAGGQPGYSTPIGTNGYAGPAYPPVPSYPPEAGYTQGTNYTQGPGYPPTGYPPTSRPGTSTYTYRDVDYQGSGDLYQQAGSYANPGRSRDARVPEPPRAYPTTDPRDLRMDTRIDPRADPRNIPGGYSSYVASPGDTTMHGADDARYDYVSTLPPIQSGRGAPFVSSRAGPPGYDPRDSPNLRDGYRNEPIREERRRR